MVLFLMIHVHVIQDNSLDEATGLSRNNKPVLPVGVQQSPPVVSSWNMSSKVNGCTTFRCTKKTTEVIINLFTCKCYNLFEKT